MDKEQDFSPQNAKNDSDKSFVPIDNGCVDPLLDVVIEYIYWLKDVKFPADHGGKKISIATVAKMTGYSVHTINNFLYGKTDDPHFFKLCRIIGALGGSVDEVIGLGAYSSPWKRPEFYSPVSHSTPDPVESAPVIPSAPAPVVSASSSAPAVSSYDDDTRDIYSLPFWQRPFVRRQRDARRREALILSSHDSGTTSALLGEIKHLRPTNSVLLVSLIASVGAIIALFSYDIMHLDRGWIQHIASFFGVSSSRFHA